MQWAVRVNEAYQRLKDPLQARRLPVRAARRADRRREQHRDAGRLPDAADGSGARRCDEARRVDSDRGARRRGGRAARRARCARLQQLLDERDDAARGGRSRCRALMFVERFAEDIDQRLEALGQYDAPWHCCRSPNPAQAPDPHQRRIAVGIDLGTTHSLVAAVRNGVRRVPARRAGPRAAAVGRALPAKAGACRSATTRWPSRPIDPRNTIVSVKRFMGRGLADIAHREKLPYDFVDAPGMVQLRTVDGVKSPVEVSAEILATLRQRAEDTFDDDLFGAVITVPAYFDDAQRQATKDAAQLAGLNVLRLINEPTAAAIAYGLENGSEGLYAVYDLGGGTFDISLLRLTQGRVRGGRDRRRLGARRRRLRPRAGRLGARRRRGSTPQTPQRQARRAGRRARRQGEAVDAPTMRRCACQLSSGELSRARARATQFEALAPAAGRRARWPRCARCCATPRSRKDEVQGVVMVGGSTRMPMVQAAVGEFFGRDAAHRPESRRGGGARRRDPGQCAGRQRRRRRTAAARRDPAVARPRDDGRPGRAHHPAQQHDPDRARAGLHHLQGRPDRDGDPRRAGRARAGQRLPLAGALRAARHSADGRRRGAHPRELPGRCRRPAARVGARGDLAASRPRSPSSRATACRTNRSRAHAARRASAPPRPTCARARCARRGSRPSACCSRRARRCWPTATC